MKVRDPIAMLRNRLNRERLYCTAEYWDAKALEHDSDAASMWNNNHLNALYYDEIAGTYAKYVPEFRGRKVLEIGCGTGRNTRFLVEQGAEVVALDFSARAIERARERLSGSTATFRTQSIFELDDQSAYDVVVSWGTITMACSHRSALEGLMGRLRRALKPGGRMVLLEPIHRGPLHRVLSMGQAEFEQVMRQAGFQIEHVQHLHFWPARLMLAFVTWPEPVTRTVYLAGQWFMGRVLHNRAGGDYQAIVASVPA